MKHEADLLASKSRCVIVGQRPDLHPRHANLTSIGRVHGTDDMQERALSRAARPDERDDFTRSDVQLDVT